MCTWRLEGGAVFSYRGSWIARGLATTYDGAWRIGGTHGSLAWDGRETAPAASTPNDLRWIDAEQRLPPAAQRVLFHDAHEGIVSC